MFKKIALFLFPILVVASNNNYSGLIVEPGMNVIIKSAANNKFQLSSQPKANITTSSSTILLKPVVFMGGKHASAEISLANPLSYLEVRGDSNVIFDNARTSKLHIVNSGTGNVSLKGNIDIAAIDLTNSGSVRAIWVNAKDLVVRSSYGIIELAGKCNSLKVMGDKDAYFNGEYLRCNNTWVRAKDNASIKVKPIRQFKVWATQNSKVYYTKMLDFLKRDTLSLDDSLVIHTDL